MPKGRPEGVAPRPAQTLNPLVDVGAERHVMVTQFLSAVPAAILTRPAHNLTDRADDIARAIDMVFQGF